MRKTNQKLLLIALGLSFLILFSSPLIPIIFGNQWTLAASILPLFIPQLICEFSVSPLSGSFLAANRAKDAILPQLLLMSVRLVTLLISSSFCSFPVTIFVYSIASGLGYIMFYISMDRCLSQQCE